NNFLRLFSFEMKKSLGKANYRESYFQTVSNSSWAHEGYVVAVDISDDEDFRAELQRLSISFGMGIIQLDLEDLDASRVLYPARPREVLDWETINKLCEQNTDFKKFLQNVKFDFESKVHPSEYDEVIQDIAQYIKDKLKLNQGA